MNSQSFVQEECLLAEMTRMSILFITLIHLKCCLIGNSFQEESLTSKDKRSMPQIIREC